MKKLLMLLAAVSLAAVANPASAQFDQIFDERGRPHQGAVTKMTPTTITLQEGGREVNYDVNTIKSLKFGDEPGELTSVRDFVRQGNMNSARDELRKIDVASIARDVVKQDVAYFSAFVDGQLALQGDGDKAGAKDKMFAFIRANPGTYHLFEGAELLGDLAMALNAPDEAARFYSALTRAESADIKLKADVLVARALLAQQNFSGALEKFEAVAAAPGDSPAMNRQKQFAQIGRAVCLAETGQPDAGIAAIDDLISKTDPRDSELFGRAYNAKGRCLVKANKKEDALLSFLHTDLMFNNVPEVHAESLYFLSQLWADVQQAERSVRARSMLTDRYGGTAWAKRQ
ncbi:MAG: tetratricopeptide repeat protein [Planctomycetales bacterium]|nr:tetratricopeptide repeat protein [Planctomycetales bacterium]